MKSKKLAKDQLKALSFHFVILYAITKINKLFTQSVRKMQSKLKSP